MTIALSTLLTGFEEYIEALAVESTADAGSDATKIVDAALSIYGDGYFNDWWIYMTDGLASGDIRQVETYTLVGTILDPYVDFSAAVAVDNTYELHKHNPDSIKRSINDALLSIYPKLYRKIVFESLGMDDLANDTVAPPQPVVEVTDDTLFFVGQKVTVKDDVASEDAIIKSIDSGANELTMEKDLTKTYTMADHAKVVAQSGKYFNLGATIGNARVTGVFIKTDEHSTRKRVTGFEIIESLAGERQIYFPGSGVSVDDQTWIIEAMGKLEELTIPASTITLEDRRVNLLYSEAAYHFYLRQSNDISAGDIDRLIALAREYRRRVYDDYRSLWLPRITEFADITTDGD